MERWWDLLVIALLGAWLLVTNLDSPLMEPDESRYAEIPRLMLRTGDWITPRLQGKPYNDKPPLVYWLIGASYWTFGVSIEAARLVPAVAGWLTLMIVYLWTRRYLGRKMANYSAFIMLTMIGYLALMRMLLLDGVLSFLVIGSLLAGHHALSQRRHAGWWLVSAIICGLGVLAKGPVAIVLVTPCLFMLRWLDRRTTPMTFLDAVWYGFVVLAIAVPWYAVMMVTNEHFGSEHFFRHHFRRFLDPAHHQQPFWYYIPALLIELLPWPILLVPVLQRWRLWTGPERFLMFFIGFCFLFFSIARAKLPTYLLPLLPLLAVMFSHELVALARKWHAALKWEGEILHSKQGIDPRRVQLGFTLSLTILLFGVTFRSWGFYYALQVGSLSCDPWALCLMMMGIGLLVFQLMTDFAVPRLAYGLVPLALLTTYCVTHHAIPDYAEAVSIVDDCQELKRLAETAGIPAVAHRNSWDAVSFARNGDELEVFSSREWPAFTAWLKQHPRAMIWMRDYEGRVETFAQSLPKGMEVEQTYDLGRVQGIIVRQTEVMQTGYEEKPEK
ncbi:MAG: glycosyltransferase family 39 protein [Gemmatales bacterium]